MKKQIIFKKVLFVGSLSFLLGLGACAIQSEDATSSEDAFFSDEEVLNVSDADTNVTSDDFNACTSDTGDCAVSDDYLTDQFSQTEVSEKSSLLDIETDSDTISLSRPAGSGFISVKDKQSAAQAIQTEEKTDTAKTVISEPKTEEKVLYTTVAIPEEIGTTKTTETTLSTTKVIKTPAEETSAAVPEGMMPLKKTITTITETTTKVKEKKPEAPKDFKKMTLAQRVEYGESVQDWAADSGKTLRGLLMDWGHRAGWTVVWKLDRDYRLEAGVVFKGTFTEVAGALIRSFARATPAPIGTFHKGNRVLVINTQENENEH